MKNRTDEIWTALGAFIRFMPHPADFHDKLDVRKKKYL
jgi:hypothetical protein